MKHFWSPNTWALVSYKRCDIMNDLRFFCRSLPVLFSFSDDRSQQLSFVLFGLKNICRYHGF